MALRRKPTHSKTSFSAAVILLIAKTENSVPYKRGVCVCVCVLGGGAGREEESGKVVSLISQ